MGCREADPSIAGGGGGADQGQRDTRRVF